MSVRKRSWKSADGEAKETWVVDYAVHGKRHIKSFPKKRDADAFASAVQVEIRGGTHVAESQSKTVAEAGELWITSAIRSGLERSTTDQYRQHLDLHIKPLIGRIALPNLSTPVVRAFQDQLKDAGRSTAMVRKITVSLGSLLADAQERGLSGRNPVRDLSKTRRRGKERQADRRQKGKLKVGLNIPSRAEIKAIVHAAEGRWRPLLLTAIFTGLRASELRGLRWQDVDFSRGELHVRQRADQYKAIGPPKSHAGERTVPVPPLALNTLREWKLQCPKGSLDLVFPTSVGNVLAMSSIITSGLIPTMIRAGVIAETEEKGSQGKPVAKAKYTGMHALRHFFASWCINPKQNGGLELTAKVVQERLGHSSIAMTMDTYGHLFPRGDDAAEIATAEASLLN